VREASGIAERLFVSVKTWKGQGKGGRMWRLSVACALLMTAISAATAQDAALPETVSRVRLRDVQKDRKTVIAPMGAGVTVRVDRSAEGLPFGEVLTVTGGGGKIFESEGGVFETAALVRSGGSFHLVVTEYTGGAHCCGQYHVFSRGGPQAAWLHVGTTGAENGGPMPAWSVLLEKGGNLYLKEWDNRFDYFHACHACSRLVNLGPQFTLIGPSKLEPANDAFRDVYQELAAAAEEEITAEAATRLKRSAAILIKKPGGDEPEFTDELGQLLVKRTVLLLRAGEEERAWDAFVADVARFFLSAEGAELLREEITEMLGK
jgi:hypothetical protein